MKTMFKILDESPTRRVIFTSERELTFPQSFLEIRWIEDEPVVDRALLVELPHKTIQGSPDFENVSVKLLASTSGPPVIKMIQLVLKDGIHSTKFQCKTGTKLS